MKIKGYFRRCRQDCKADMASKEYNEWLGSDKHHHTAH
jgi:hypothetical protein